MITKFPMFAPIPYAGWTQYTPVIPKFYWNVYSAEQRLKQLCMNFDKVEHYLEYIAQLMSDWNIEFTEELQKELAAIWDAVRSGYEDAIHDWFINELPGIINDAIRMVFFGLTDDGYFCAYIPELWRGILFDTIIDYDSPDYGKLTITY